MAGETDLARLIATMTPVVREGEYVVVSLTVKPDVDCEAVIREAEGVTCVVARAIADEHDWPYDFVGGWVTLQVHSALEAVGLTAAVSAAMTAEGIPCNVLAGFFHDHLLVPADRVPDTVRVLEELSARGAPDRRSPYAVRRSPGRRSADKPTDDH
jgi:uncharacterized protein